MKILYISHQKENSGYGRSCRDYLKALKATGFEIASYPIVLGKPGDFKDETETNVITGCDIVINHTLPHYWSYNGKFDKNIGIFLKETKNIVYTDWQQYLNIVDVVWIPNTSGLGYRTIPQPIDIEIYNHKYPNMEIPEINGTYKFYTICEASKRKNLSALIRGYFEAFHYSDPVSLILKVTKPGYSTEQVEKEIQDLIDKTANGCRLYQSVKDYPRVYVIGQTWTNDQICALHKYCDCFVSTSYGESICYPMIDAMGFNKEIISSDNDSSYYGNFGTINTVHSIKEPCYGEMDAFQGHVTSRESWYSINIELLAQMMNKIAKTEKQEIKHDLSPLSYENIAKKIIEELV